MNDSNKTTEEIIQSFQEQIDLKDKELKELKIELENIKKQNYNQNNNKDRMVHENEIASVFFTSNDQKINFAVSCLKSSIFAEVEEKLYKEYPEYRETNNYFLSNGKQILRFKTIEQNNIGNGRPVILILPNDY